MNSQQSLDSGLSESKESRWRLHLTWVLAIVQLVLSIYAVGAKYFGTCKSCKGVFTSVVPASMGVCTYLLIIVLLETKKWRLASLLTFVALCAHALLFSHLIISEQRCILCLSVFLGSIALFLSIHGLDTRIALSTYATLAVFVMIVGTLAISMLPGDERFRFVESIPEQYLPLEDGSVTVLMVEASDCGACQDFRNVMAPRLQKEFGNRIRFLSVGQDKVEVPSTPTFVVGRSRNALKVATSDIAYPTMREWVLAMLAGRLE